MVIRGLFASLLLALAVYTGGANESLDQASTRFEQQTAKVPAALRIEFRMRAAQALTERHPNLARKFVNLAVQEIRSGRDWQLGNAVLQAFAVVAPSDGVAILPYLAPPQIAMMTGALARANRVDEAMALYRQSLARGDLQTSSGYALLVKLVKEKPAEAGKLFQEMLSAAHFETLEPYEAYGVLNCAKAVVPVAAPLAVEACERIAAAASAADYGAKATTAITGTFQVGAGTVTTANSRDTLLVVSGSRLREWAPARFEERKALFERWNLAGPPSVKSVSFRHSDAPPAKKDEPDTSAISKQIGQLRGLPTDADRARMVIQIARRHLRAASGCDARWPGFGSRKYFH